MTKRRRQRVTTRYRTNCEPVTYDLTVTEVAQRLPTLYTLHEVRRAVRVLANGRQVTKLPKRGGRVRSLDLFRFLN